MPARNRGQLAAFGQLLERIAARRLEQAIAGDGAADIRRDQRLRHEIDDAVDDLRGAGLIFARRRDRGLQGEAAGKNGQATQHQARAVVEQVMAPIERGAQRLMSRQRGAPTAGEQLKTVVEARRQRLQAERGRARGRELDRQRNAVEAPHDHGDGGGRAIIRREGGIGSPRARQEKPRGAVGRNPADAVGAFGRHAQRRHAVDIFAFRRQGLAAGRQHVDPRRRPHSASASPAAASRTCSQVSSTSSRRFSRSAAAT